MKRKTIRFLFFLIMFLTGISQVKAQQPLLNVTSAGSDVTILDVEGDPVDYTCLDLDNFEGQLINVTFNVRVAVDGSTNGLGTFSGSVILAGMGGFMPPQPGATGIQSIGTSPDKLLTVPLQFEDGKLIKVGIDDAPTTGDALVPIPVQFQVQRPLTTGTWTFVLNVLTGYYGDGSVAALPVGPMGSKAFQIDTKPEVPKITDPAPTSVCSWDHAIDNSINITIDVVDPEVGVEYWWELDNVETGLNAIIHPTYYAPNDNQYDNHLFFKIDGLYNTTSEPKTITVSVYGKRQGATCRSVSETYTITVNPVPSIVTNDPATDFIFLNVCQDNTNDFPVDIQTLNTTKFEVSDFEVYDADNVLVDDPTLDWKDWLKEESLGIDADGKATILFDGEALAANKGYRVSFNLVPFYVNEDTECPGEAVPVSITTCLIKASEYGLSYGVTVIDLLNIDPADALDNLCSNVYTITAQPDASTPGVGPDGYEVTVGNTLLDGLHPGTYDVANPFNRTLTITNNETTPQSVEYTLRPYILDIDGIKCYGDLFTFTLTFEPVPAFIADPEHTGYTCPSDNNPNTVGDYTIKAITAGGKFLVLRQANTPGVNVLSLNSTIEFPLVEGSETIDGITAVTTFDPILSEYTTIITVPEANLQTGTGRYGLDVLGSCGSRIWKGLDIEVEAAPPAPFFDMAGKTLQYFNGDMVNDIWLTPYHDNRFSSPYEVYWERVETSDQVSGGDSPRESGTNIIPRFWAVNNDVDTKRAVYKFYVVNTLTNCKFYADADLVIQVDPKTVADDDLSVAEIEDIFACEGSTLDKDVILKALYSFGAGDNALTRTDFKNLQFNWKLRDGANVLKDAIHAATLAAQAAADEVLDAAERALGDASEERDEAQTAYSNDSTAVLQIARLREIVERMVPDPDIENSFDKTRTYVSEIETNAARALGHLNETPPDAFAANNIALAMIPVAEGYASEIKEYATRVRQGVLRAYNDSLDFAKIAKTFVEEAAFPIGDGVAVVADLLHKVIVSYDVAADSLLSASKIIADAARKAQDAYDQGALAGPLVVAAEAALQTATDEAIAFVDQLTTEIATAKVSIDNQNSTLGYPTELTDAIIAFNDLNTKIGLAKVELDKTPADAEAAIAIVKEVRGTYQEYALALNELGDDLIKGATDKAITVVTNLQTEATSSEAINLTINSALDTYNGPGRMAAQLATAQVALVAINDAANEALEKLNIGDTDGAIKVFTDNATIFTTAEAACDDIFLAQDVLNHYMLNIVHAGGGIDYATEGRKFEAHMDVFDALGVCGDWNDGIDNPYKVIFRDLYNVYNIWTNQLLPKGSFLSDEAKEFADALYAAIPGYILKVETQLSTLNVYTDGAIINELGSIRTDLIALKKIFDDVKDANSALQVSKQTANLLNELISEAGKLVTAGQNAWKQQQVLNEIADAFDLAILGNGSTIASVASVIEAAEAAFDLGVTATDEYDAAVENAKKVLTGIKDRCSDASWFGAKDAAGGAFGPVTGKMDELIPQANEALANSAATLSEKEQKLIEAQKAYDEADAFTGKFKFGDAEGSISAVNDEVTFAFAGADFSGIGSGLYAITPKWNNAEGKTVLFRVTVEETPTITYLGTDRGPYTERPIIYNAGDLVKIQVEGALWYHWQGGADIGLIAGSGATVPSFIAREGRSTIQINGISPNGCEGPVRRIVLQVNPAVVLNADNIDSTLCYNTASDIVTGINLPDTQELILKLVSGPGFGVTLAENGFDLAVAAYENNSNELVSSVYSLTATDKDTKAESQNSVLVRITVAPKANIGTITDIVASNGDYVPSFTFTGNATSGTYSWTLKEGNNPSANLATTGEGNSFPSFVAVNRGTTSLTATYEVIAYSANKDCTPDRTTFKITVYPDAAIGGTVSNATICTGSNYNETLTSLENTSYELQFVSGKDFGLTITGVTISKTGLTNTTKAPLTGVYRITAVNTVTNAKGATQDFSVTVLPAANLDTPADIVTVSGSIVPAFSFTGNVTGGTYSWELTSTTTPSANLASKGEGYVFPWFEAINNTNAPITATYNVTAHSGDLQTGCTDTKQFKITVYPRPEVVDVINNITVCDGTGFTTITLANQSGVGVGYKLSNVGGTNFGLTLVGNGIQGGTLANQTNAPLTGIYAVTPYNTTTLHLGTPKYFTLTVLPKPVLNQPERIARVNGEPEVATFNFTGNVVGGTYSWAKTNGNATSLDLPERGESATFPAFWPVNNTNDSIWATYTVTAKSGDCTPEEKVFTVTVYPTPKAVNIKDVEICVDANYAIPTLLANPRAKEAYRDLERLTEANAGLLFNEVTGVFSGKAANTTNAPLVAKYRVTPYNTEREIDGAPVEFTVTVYPAAKLDDPKDIVRVSGEEEVPTFSFTGNVEGGTYSWVANADYTAYNLPIKGETAEFPAFIPVNNTNATVTATYTVTAKSGVCVAKDETFTITIYPALKKVAEINDVTLCDEADFTPIVLDAQVGVAYRLELVSGTATGISYADDVRTISGKVANTTNAPISGTYRVTPYSTVRDNVEGPAVEFTVTVDPKAALNDIAAIQRVSGETIAVTFSGNVESGFYTWATKNGADYTAYNLPKSGEGAQFSTLPLVNNTNAFVTATYVATAHSGVCTTVSKEFTITLYPAPKIPADFEIASEILCAGSEYASVALPANLISQGTDFRVEQVDGVDVGLTYNSTTRKVEAKPLVNNGEYRVSATFKITPFNTVRNIDGTSSIEFTISVDPKAGLNELVDITTVNGITVPAFNFSGNPVSGSYSWKLKAGETPLQNLATEGNGPQFPSFVAENFGDEKVSATYVVNAKSGVCDAEPQEFTITVYPTPKVTLIDEIKDATYCSGYEYEATLADQSAKDVAYRFAYKAGTDLGLDYDDENRVISGTLENATNAPISGTYTVTPYNTETGHEGDVVTFTITVQPDLDAAIERLVVDSRTVKNGETVSEIRFSSVLAGATYEWVRTGSNIGGDVKGTAYIPSFTAVNTTSAAISATYSVTLKYGECVSEDAATFTITVGPKLVDDPNLTVKADKVNQSVCHGDNFADVTLTADYRFETVNGVEFEWKLVNGTDVVGAGSAGSIPATETNVATWNLAAATGTAIGTGTYRITPIWQNYRGVSIDLTLERKAKPEVYTINDVVLCSGSSLDVTFTGLNASTYSWSVVAAKNSNDAKESVLGLASGTKVTGLKAQNLVNIADAERTDVIRVVPVEGNCEGDAVYFSVTILPTPTVNAINSMFVESNKEIPATPFTGTANSYRWRSSNPQINATSAASSGEGTELPAFTSQNVHGSPIASTITVTPIWKQVNGTAICEGQSISFDIVIAAKPVITQIIDVEVCDGEKAPQVNVNGLNDASSYYITWEGGASIGLTDSKLAGIKSVSAFNVQLPADASKDVPTTVLVTVTPKVSIGGKEYDGDAVAYRDIVYPKTRLAAGFASTDAARNIEICGESTDPETLSVSATGYALTYQWYKDEVAIAGATSADYVIDGASADQAGKYYAIVSGRCNSVKAVTYNVIVKPQVISQRWNDVLIINTDTETNGGYVFTGIQWYKNNTPVGTGLTYLHEAGGLDITANYRFTANDGKFVSCDFTPDDLGQGGISVYPNPVEAGELLNVKGAPENATIQLVSSTGATLSTTTNKGGTTEIRMPNTVGVYIIHVIENNVKRSFSVIVK
jgi:hypothetical protein